MKHCTRHARMTLPPIRDITRDLPDLTHVEEQAILEALASVLAGERSGIEVERHLAAERGNLTCLGNSMLREHERQIHIKFYELLLEHFAELL